MPALVLPRRSDGASSGGPLGPKARWRESGGCSWRSLEFSGFGLLQVDTRCGSGGVRRERLGACAYERLDGSHAPQRWRCASPSNGTKRARQKDERTASTTEHVQRDPLSVETQVARFQDDVPCLTTAVYSLGAAASPFIRATNLRFQGGRPCSASQAERDG